LNNFEGWYVDDVQLAGLGTWTDYYSFTVGANQSVSAALKYVTGSGANVFLEDASGNVLGTGQAGASNYDRGISNLAISTPGTSSLRVSGGAPVTYNLVVTRGAVFEAEPNDSSAAAQSMSGTHGALGYVNSVPGGVNTVVPGSLANTEASDNNGFPFNL